MVFIYLFIFKFFAELLNLKTKLRHPRNIQEEIITIYYIKQKTTF